MNEYLRRMGTNSQAMMTRESTHYRAADAFTRQVREQYDDIVETVVLYGSVARGEERGVHSDVDLIVVLADGVDKQVAEHAIRELAYDIELEFGVVLSLLVLASEEYHHSDEPYLQHVHQDGQPLYG